MTKSPSSAPGFIGRAWAITFARAGHEVALWDQDRGLPPRQAVDFIADVLADLAANDLLNGQPPERGARRASRRGRTLEAALAGADHVQENTPERSRDEAGDLRAARSRSRRPDAVLASSTSAILPSTLHRRRSPGRHRCLVVHPINPPYLIPAAEVVPAPWTDPEIVERTRATSCARPARRRSS